jgi:hypothetical protein
MGAPTDHAGMAPATDISVDAPADFTDDATALTIVRPFLELDSLAEALCECADSPAWLVSVDPMLDKLAVLLVATRPLAS